MLSEVYLQVTEKYHIGDSLQGGVLVGRGAPQVRKE